MLFLYRPGHGAPLEIDLEGAGGDDDLYRAIRDSGSFYELPLLEYAAAIMARKKNGQAVCVDVGANIGNHSVFFGKLVADHVVSVEPNPQVLPMLRRNLQRNLANYTVCECALGVAEGTGRIVMPEGSGHNVGMARVEVSDQAARDGAEVHVRTLDGLLEDVRRDRGLTGRVLLVKIDVEGAELDVLKGATRTLAEDKPHLLVEAATADRQRVLASFLDGFGYRSLSRWSSTPVLHYACRPSPVLRLRVWFYRTLRRARRRRARRR